MKAIAIAAAGMAVLAGSAASAESLAAPGDCAQPIRDIDTGPIAALPAAGGIAGPPAAHFAPIAVVGGAVRLLPLDLTRATSATIDAAATTVDGAVDTTATTVDGAVGAVGTAGDAIGETTQQIEQQIERTTQPIDLPGSTPVPDPTPVLEPTINTLKGIL